jgi:neutral ceramidase
MSQHFEIGFGRELVTPPVGSPMAGFDARKGVAEGVHDHLYARAVVFNDAALISVDVIGFDGAFTARVRREIESRTRIPAAHVILSGTHTHCGPVTFNHFFNQGQRLDEATSTISTSRLFRPRSRPPPAAGPPCSAPA